MHAAGRHRLSPCHQAQGGRAAGGDPGAAGAGHGLVTRASVSPGVARVDRGRTSLLSDGAETVITSLTGISLSSSGRVGPEEFE
jgi:hypothetical protein